MTDREYQKLKEIAEKDLREKPTKEEALATLQAAGILDRDGNFTPIYEDLNLLFKR